MHNLLLFELNFHVCSQKQAQLTVTALLVFDLLMGFVDYERKESKAAAYLRPSAPSVIREKGVCYFYHFLLPV